MTAPAPFASAAERLKHGAAWLAQSAFARNVATVAGGTAMAQAITLAFAPLITRLYGPEAFGVQGTFMALAALVMPLAALAYPVAIVLPEGDGEARGILRLSLATSGVVALLVLLLVLGVPEAVLARLGLGAIAGYLWLLPVFVAASGAVQAGETWLARKGLFRVSARIAVAQSFGVNAGKAALGLVSATAFSLIAAAAVGILAQVAMLAVGARRSLRLARDGGERLAALARRYRDFPLYRAPEMIVRALSEMLPILLLASAFGPAEAGFFALARATLVAPVTLIGGSVGRVFYPRFTRGLQQHDDLTRLLRRTTLSLAAVGLPLFAMVALVGPWLYGVLFGAEWTRAGEYARWLSVLQLLLLVARPGFEAATVLSRQKVLFAVTLATLLAQVAAFWLAVWLSGDDIAAVVAHSLAGASCFAAFLVYADRIVAAQRRVGHQED